MLARVLTAVVLILHAVGGMTNAYSSDPNRRMLQLMNQSEDLRQIQREWEHFWMIDQPSHLTDERTRGGTPPDGIPATSSVPKVTIANVRKEAATILITISGELHYYTTLPPGEAIDIALSTGQKAAAVFANTEPHCVNYTRKGVEAEVWLLRPDPATSTPLRFGLGLNAE